MALKRVLTAAVLIPVVVLIVWWGPPWLVAGVAILVLLLALHEFFHLGAQVGLRAYRLWTMVCAAALVFAQWSAGGIETHTVAAGIEMVRNASRLSFSIEQDFVAFLLGAAVISVAGRMALAEILPAVGVSSAALVLVALPFSYLVRLDGEQDSGAVLILFTLAVIWVGDSVAYLVGKTIGRTPMAPALSPKKTWEGAVGNMAGSLITGFCFARWMGSSIAPWLGVAALANIAGQVGDLLESAYKRGAGVKDSGALLPGHGGMLDRIDSLILAAPVVWLLAGWLRLGR